MTEGCATAGRLGERPAWRSAAVILSGPVVVLTGMQLILPVLPVMQSELGLTDVQISLVSSVYLLPGALLAIPAGMLADVLGHRRLFGCSLIGFGVAGAIQFLHRDLLTILMLRFVQGVAFAAILPLTVTMIGELWSRHQQLRSQGLRVVGMNVANVVWPVVGGFVSTRLWYAAFALQALAIPVGVAALRLLPDGQGRGKRGHRVRVPEIVRSMATPLGLAVEASAFLRFVLRFGFLTYVPILLVGGRGMSPAETGVIIGAAAVCGTVTAGVTGRLAVRLEPSRLMAAAAAVVVVGVVVTAAGGLGSWIGPVIYGLGDGVFAVLHSGFMTEAAPRSARASFVAATTGVKNLGKFLGPSIVAGVVLVIPLPAAFLVLAGGALLLIPLPRLLRELDSTLAPEIPGLRLE